MSQRRSISLSAALWSVEVRIGLMSMTCLDGGGVDFVVLGVRADEANVDGEERVFDGDDDPILVALQVEDDAVAREDACRRVTHLDVLGAAPVAALELVEPGEERLPSIGVLVGKRPDRRAVEDAHTT